MASLFSLTEEYQRLLEFAEDPEVDPVAFADTLESLQYEFDGKAEGYCMVIRQLEADMKAFNDAAQEFLRKKTVCESSIKRMKTALKTAMEKTGQKKIEAGLFKVSIAGNGGKRPMTIYGDVPEQFKVVRYENDNEKIRNYLETLGNPEACTWAKLEEYGTHLSIK